VISVYAGAMKTWALAIAMMAACGEDPPARPRARVEPEEPSAQPEEVVAEPAEPPAPAIVQDPAPRPPVLRTFVVPADFDPTNVPVLPTEEIRYTDGILRVRISVVQHPDRGVRSELEAVLRESAAAMLSHDNQYVYVGAETSADGHMTVVCTPTLAHARLVSYECHSWQENDRGGSDRYKSIATFAIEHGQLVEVDAYDLFEDSGIVDSAAEEALGVGDCGYDGFGIAPAGVVACGVEHGSNSAGFCCQDVPWADMRRLELLADGPIAALFPDAAVRERTIEVPSSSTTCAFVVSGEATYGELYARARPLGDEAPTHVMPIDGQRGRLVRTFSHDARACDEDREAATALAARLGSIAHPVVHRQAPLRFERVRTGASINLRRAPIDGEIMRAVPHGALIDVLLGPIPGAPSEMGLTRDWALAFVPGSEPGWISGRWLTATPRGCGGTIDARTLTGGAQARIDGVAVWVHYEAEPRGEATHLAIHRSDPTCARGELLAAFDVPGALFDVRFPTRTRDGDSLVMIASGATGPLRYALYDLSPGTPLWTHDVPMERANDVHLTLARAGLRGAWIPVSLRIGSRTVSAVMRDGAIATEER
jgi:hypothetical protein